MRGLLIVPRPFPAHILRAHAFHVKYGLVLRNYARRLRKFSLGKQLHLPAFQQSLLTLTTMSKVRSHKYRGLLIVPHPFPAHISRAHVCHGKIRSGFPRLRLKVEKFSLGKQLHLPAFQQSLLHVTLRIINVFE